MGIKKIRAWTHRSGPAVRYWPVAAVLGLSLSAAFWVSQTVRQQIAARDRLRFENFVDQVSESLTLTLRNHVRILESARGLFAASRSVEPQEWDIFVRGILADREQGDLEWIGYMSREGDFPPTPGKSGLLSGAAPDCGSECRAFADDAAELACAEGVAVMTPVHMGGGYATTLHTLLVLPVYGQPELPGSVAERRAALTGWVVACASIEELVAAAIGPLAPLLELDLREGGGSGSARLLYSGGSSRSAASAAATAGLTASRLLHVPGATWSLQARPQPAFFRSVEQTLPRLTLAIGILASALLAAGAAALIAGRSRAQHAAARATLNLHRNLARTQAILGTTTDGLLTLDPQLHITYANPEAGHLLGEPAERLQRRPLATVLGAAGTRIAADARGVQRAGRRVYREVHLGADVYLELCIDPTDDGVLVTLRDVSDRKQAERAIRESEELYRQIFAHSADGMFLMREVFEDCNPRVCEMWGVTREEVLGRSPVVFSPPRQPDGRTSAESAAERIAAALAGTPQFFEWQHLHRGGRPVDTEISLVAVPVRGRPMLLATMRDVSARKRAEVELQRARSAAVAADHAKGQFLANMSHEIRTPMNGILGVTELLLEGDLPDQEREHLKVVRSCAESLMRVINDVLDFSKIEAGRLDLECEPLVPAEVAREALETLALNARQKGLEIGLEIAPGAPPTLFGDALRLRQVLLNLIGNGIKFTERGSVQVLIESEARRLDWLHIVVRDTGMGIPADKQIQVFEAFAQADGSTTRRFGGTGLGLSISSQLVRLMGGEISLESEVGRGSTFHIRLPLLPPDAASAPGARPGTERAAA
ncbi:MAG: ATP-binding protein [Candidatus Eisenbacteria bacterium]